MIKKSNLSIFCLILIISIASLSSIRINGEKSVLLENLNTKKEREVRDKDYLYFKTQKVSLAIDENYTNHSPIIILSDNELANESVNGTGTEVDPYIFENWLIKTNSTHAIVINSTTKHFIIRNCWIETFSLYNGIFINSVANGTCKILNNTCFNNNYGILINNSNCSIANYNSCYENRYGIFIENSSLCRIYNNNCSQNTYFGIRTYYTDYIEISNNFCQNNSNEFGIGNGIRISFCLNSIISNNYILNNYYGIYAGIADYCQIIKNVVNKSNRGIRVSESNCVTIIDNICTDITNTGISLAGSSSSMISNNTCRRNIDGITLINSNQVSIINNSCDYNTYCGISLQVDNVDTTICNNSCNQNYISGINLYKSYSTLISNNTCNFNNISGIKIEDTFLGTITANNCSYNGEIGLILSNSNQFLIRWNEIAENAIIGISILENTSKNNLIHHNNFINNGKYSNIESQAFDEGKDNIWCFNYWNDYNAEDRNYYSIAGNNYNFDPYPLLVKVEVGTDLPPNYSHPDQPIEYNSSESSELLIVFSIIIILSTTVAYYKYKK